MSALLFVLAQQLSSIWSLFSLFSLVVGIFVYKTLTKKQDVKWPPSKAAWPIFGHLPMIDRLYPHKTFTKWAEELGPIIGVRMGLTNAVVLSDVDVLKEAFSRDASAGRPDIDVLMALSGGPFGIVATNGEEWKEQRRFTLSVLRDFGLGRSVMEENIKLEIENMLSHINGLVAEQDPDRGVDTSMAIKNTIANVILSLMFGERFETGDPDFKENQQRTFEIIRNFDFVHPSWFFGPIRHIWPKPATIKKVEEHSQVIRHSFIRPRIEKQAALLKAKPDTEARNVAMAYLKHLQKHANTTDDKTHWFNLRQLESILNDLFFAGFETSATTLSWAWLFMVHWPDVQRKVQLEMETLGHQPTWEDRKRLPYTVGTITEIQRRSNVAAFAGLHFATAEFTIRGYTIPKGTVIIPNLFGAHMNEKSFPEPLNFKPERFIDPISGVVTDSDKIIPFSSGKRVCLGEGLARMEIFLIFTAVLYNFSFEVLNGKQLPTLEPAPGGGTLSPQPYTLKLLRRSVH